MNFTTKRMRKKDKSTMLRERRDFFPVSAWDLLIKGKRRKTADKRNIYFKFCTCDFIYFNKYINKE